MGVLSEGEGGRGIPGVDSGLWMPFSQPGGERDRERKREKEGSELGSAQLKRTSRLRLVAVLKKASAASNWVQVSSSIVLFASEGKGEREGGREGRGAGGWGKREGGVGWGWGGGGVGGGGEGMGGWGWGEGGGGGGGGGGMVGWVGGGGEWGGWVGERDVGVCTQEGVVRVQQRTGSSFHPWWSSFPPPAGGGTPIGAVRPGSCCSFPPS
jgi:hypothetical protein